MRRGVLAVWLLASTMAFVAGHASAAAPAPKAKSPPPKAKSPAPKPKTAAPPPKSSGQCQDASPQCKRFADLGYCTSRPVYMVGTAAAPGNCLATCKKCPAGTCRDSSAQCPHFASLGYCTSRPVYMIGTDKTSGNCLASCNSCVAAPPPSPKPPAVSPFFSAPNTGKSTIRSLARNNFCMMPHPVGGRIIIFKPCDGSNQQLWTWSRSAGTLVASNGLCITYNANLAEGSPVNLQACVSPVNKLQRWAFEPYVINALTPLSDAKWGMHINNTNNGVTVKMARVPSATLGIDVIRFSAFQLYPAKCSDLSPQCPTWAKQERCTSDPLYMLGDEGHIAACPVSCHTCPVASPRPPSPKPASPRPPRGGGAQGGQCVQSTTCTGGYEYQTSYFDMSTFSYIDGPVCVLAEVSYAPRCAINYNYYCFWQCEDCEAGYYLDRGLLFYEDCQPPVCVKPGDYYTLCAPPPAMPDAASPPPLSPSTPPPLAPPSPPRPAARECTPSEAYRCAWNYRQCVCVITM